MTTTTQFEHITCTRCDGTGHYSYCQMHGTRCFKCGGNGWTYTARGQAAREYYESLLTKPAADIVIGDKIYCEPSPVWSGGWWTVETITKLDNGVLVFNGTLRNDKVDAWGKPEQCLRVAQTTEFKRAKIAEALEYQATLTKSGTPRKRK